MGIITHRAVRERSTELRVALHRDRRKKSQQVLAREVQKGEFFHAICHSP